MGQNDCLLFGIKFVFQGFSHRVTIPDILKLQVLHFFRPRAHPWPPKKEAFPHCKIVTYDAKILGAQRVRTPFRQKSNCYTFALYHEPVKCYNFEQIFVLGGQLHALRHRKLPKFKNPWFCGLIWGAMGGVVRGHGPPKFWGANSACRVCRPQLQAPVSHVQSCTRVTTPPRPTRN